MARNGFLVSLLMAFVATSPWVYSQQMTEIYIPLGQSPGVSDDALIGEIVDVNSEAHTLKIRGPSGLQTVEVTKGTWVYLDRSRLKLANLYGDYGDFATGQTVEVKFQDPARRQVADWVKIDVATGN